MRACISCASDAHKESIARDVCGPAVLVGCDYTECAICHDWQWRLCQSGGITNHLLPTTLTCTIRARMRMPGDFCEWPATPWTRASHLRHSCVWAFTVWAHTRRITINCHILVFIPGFSLEYLSSLTPTITKSISFRLLAHSASSSWLFGEVWWNS